MSTSKYSRKVGRKLKGYVFGDALEFNGTPTLDNHNTRLSSIPLSSHRIVTYRSKNEKTLLDSIMRQEHRIALRRADCQIAIGKTDAMIDYWENSKEALNKKTKRIDSPILKTINAKVEKEYNQALGTIQAIKRGYEHLFSVIQSGQNYRGFMSA